MSKIDITKIAVKFDVNTSAEEFNKCIHKYFVLGYDGPLEDITYEDIDEYPYLAIETKGELWQVNEHWYPLKNYTIMSAQEFLALQNELVPATSGVPVLALSDNDTIIAEWLNKLQYVFDKDITLQSFDYSTMTIGTDFGDISETESVVKFINLRYEEITNAENTQRKAELEAKRQKLMDELSEIDQQLGLYK